MARRRPSWDCSYGLKAFICMLVAGNRYFEGVMVVGLAIGVIEAAGHGLPVLQPGAMRRRVFVLIGVLYFRPNGLFGSYRDLRPDD